MAVFEEVTVTVYLGAGDHYLFSCADGYNYDVSADSTVTDFCSEIPTLQNVYSPTDVYKISILPLYCSGTAPSDATELIVFNANCLADTERPAIHQLDPHAYFNVTNTFEVKSI